ncbi:hypothetical protein K431DRAFT_289005 [Polychaeton citri CBS 116435]|uniref:Uncharacterized protein n=1 Tax=Polychaeton citri CBS 116435 TaxID=1314669 RepID=A0A9P4Q1U6_9PEZI|nr:hypothetical protein K431DRAFT_289005 [Polychaeton citri CBS 116435]
MSYSRPYVRGKDNVSSGFIARYRDSWPSLSDSEDDRGHTSDWHTSNEDMEDVKTNAAPQLSEGLSKRTIASDQPLRIPPRVPAPIPPLRDCDRRTTNPYVHPIYSDLPDTEQTYGATDQLLASPTTVRVGSDAQKESPTYASRSRTETTIALAESGNAMHAHNIGIAMTTNCRTASDVPELPSIWSNSDFRQARSRQNVCRSHTHTRQAGSQDGSEWATEVDSQDGNEGYLPAVPLNPFARCPRPVSGDSYADTSVYESAFDDNDYQTVVTRHEVGAARRFPEEQHDADMCGMPLTDQLTVNRRQDAVENLRQVRQRRREHAAAEDAIDQVTAHMSPAEPAGAMSMVHEDSPLDRISKSCKYWGDFLKSSLWSESTRAVKSDTELSILNGGNPTNRGDSSSMGDYRSRASMRPETSTPNSGLLQPAQDSWTPLPFPAAAHVNTTSRTPMRPRRMRAGQQESVERQIELQPLNLARDRAPARSRYGPLTDSELILHEPRWTEHVRSRSLLPTITAFSTTAARDRQQVNAHDSLEGWWVEVCLAFPLSPLLLGLGAFDWAVRHFSRGRITEVAPSLKRASLTTMLPLNLLVWGVIAGMVTLFVWIGHRAAGGE